VYTLWRNPGILPLLHCGSNVIERLQDGADLMTPGVIGGPPFPKKATKGAIVAIAGHIHPSVPMVVGTCEIDVSMLLETQGAKGRAVQTVHWSGDEIWSWDASGNPGKAPPDHIDGWLEEDDIEELRKDAEDIDLHEDGKREGGVSLTATNGSQANGAAGVEEDNGREFTMKGRSAHLNTGSWLTRKHRDRRRVHRRVFVRR